MKKTHSLAISVRKVFNIITHLTITIALLFCLNSSNAQQKVIQLYNGLPHGSGGRTSAEQETIKNPMNTKLVYNITQATLTAFIPDVSKSNGTAVIVCPGGAFQTLFIDWEGYDIARWLNEKGIAAFVLKYRTYHLVSDDPYTEMMDNINDSSFYKHVVPVWNMELNDAKIAVIYLRQHTKEYGINPSKIGIIGFSAGGSVSALLAYNYTTTTRPDFVASFYGFISDSIRKSGVQYDAPPLFIAAATDDELVPVTHSLLLYNDWVQSKHSAELHIFSKGGHGFALRKKNLPVNEWTNLFLNWMNVQGLLKR